MDHVGLSYPDLEPVMAHLAAAGIPIVEGPYPFGETRALLIEDLDGLANAKGSALSNLLMNLS